MNTLSRRCAPGRADSCSRTLRASRLVDAIRVVATGDAIVDPRVTRRLLDRFSRRLPASAGHGGQEKACCAQLAGLTERETEVLALVARGLSNGEIAAELMVTETTIKTHVHHLLRKPDWWSIQCSLLRPAEGGLVFSDGVCLAGQDCCLGAGGGERAVGSLGVEGGLRGAPSGPVGQQGQHLIDPVGLVAVAQDRRARLDPVRGAPVER